MLRRVVAVLFEYDRARKAGNKHSESVNEAVEAVRKKFPEMPISHTTVKRILAANRKYPFSMLASEGDPSIETIRRANGREIKVRVLFSVGFGATSKVSAIEWDSLVERRNDVQCSEVAGN